MIGQERIQQYFVDEAGDAVIFDKKGHIIINHAGCSRYFMLGVLDLKNSHAIVNELESLRSTLLADPYFKNVPSMQPSANKTFYAFHAKDDLPEVRREVFSILRRHSMRFLAVVRDKFKVLEYVRQRNSQDFTYRYHPNELYDYMVRVLFKNLLHKEDKYEITFSKRGKQDRTQSLIDALFRAQQRYAEQRKTDSRSVLKIFPKLPRECIPLQVVDYFLWSLQRLYEKREDRYLEMLWPSISLVHDLDDVRRARYGCYYTQKKPLSAAALDDDLPEI